MTEVVLCVGSNVDDAVDKINDAVVRLQDAGCDIQRKTDVYPSPSLYHNCVAIALTDLDYESLHSATKAIELDLGRLPELKPLGIVPVDIDIVVYGGRVVRPNDYKAKYFIQGYNAIR